MEAVGVFHDEEWESLSKMFACEDSDFLLTSVGSYGFSSNAQPSSFTAEESSFLPSATNLDHMTNFYSEISQESSNSGDIEGTLFPENGHNSINYYCCNNDDGFMAPVFSDDIMQEILQLKTELSEMGSCNEMQQLKRKYDETPQDHNNNNDLSDQSPKKKACGCREAQKTKKDSRKKKKTVQISNDEGNGQTSSTCSSQEDDSNAKGKANRATATDAQSLYARRRRERINERLRILQNLVPNGTKVDISTMLEEAVHYVKFLQLQINNSIIAKFGRDVDVFSNCIQWDGHGPLSEDYAKYMALINVVADASSSSSSSS